MNISRGKTVFLIVKTFSGLVFLLLFEFFEFLPLLLKLAPLLLKLKLLVLLLGFLILHFVTHDGTGDASQRPTNGGPSPRTPNDGTDNCASCRAETRASQCAFLSG